MLKVLICCMGTFLKYHNFDFVWLCIFFHIKICEKSRNESFVEALERHSLGEGCALRDPTHKSSPPMRDGEDRCTRPSRSEAWVGSTWRWRGSWDLVSLRKTSLLILVMGLEVGDGKGLELGVQGDQGVEVALPSIIYLKIIPQGQQNRQGCTNGF